MTDQKKSDVDLSNGEILHALLNLGKIASSQNALFLSITEALVPAGGFKEDSARRAYFASMRQVLSDVSAFNDHIRELVNRLAPEELAGERADGED